MEGIYFVCLSRESGGPRVCAWKGERGRKEGERLKTQTADDPALCPKQLEGGGGSTKSSREREEEAARRKASEQVWFFFLLICRWAGGCGWAPRRAGRSCPSGAGWGKSVEVRGKRGPTPQTNNQQKGNTRRLTQNKCLVSFCFFSLFLVRAVFFKSLNSTFLHASKPFVLRVRHPLLPNPRARAFQNLYVHPTTTLLLSFLI